MEAGVLPFTGRAAFSQAFNTSEPQCMHLLNGERSSHPRELSELMHKITLYQI